MVYLGFFFYCQFYFDLIGYECFFGFNIVDYFVDLIMYVGNVFYMDDGFIFVDVVSVGLSSIRVVKFVVSILGGSIGEDSGVE